MTAAKKPRKKSVRKSKAAATAKTRGLDAAHRASGAAVMALGTADTSIGSAPGLTRLTAYVVARQGIGTAMRGAAPRVVVISG